MYDLIWQLKKDHVVLFDILFKSREYEAGSQLWRESLLAFKDEFLRHARKEEELLYPALARAGQNDPGLLRTAGQFLAGMKRVAAEVERFAGKHAGGGHPQEFIEDYRRIFVTLKARTEQEEGALFREYKKIS